MAQWISPIIISSDFVFQNWPVYTTIKNGPKNTICFRICRAIMSHLEKKYFKLETINFQSNTPNNDIKLKY